MGGSGKSWSPIVPHLVNHREVVTIDLPGHGETAARP
ncbi:MAG: alpha/beta hydrolase, partial [Alteraurantiacibacter sp.]